MYAAGLVQLSRELIVYFISRYWYSRYLSLKPISESDLKEYEKTHNSILKQLVDTYQNAETTKKELVIRLIEVSEPLCNGKLCSEPQELANALWKEFEKNGIAGWIGHTWFYEQVPDGLKRKYHENPDTESFVEVDKFCGDRAYRSYDQKRIKIGDKTYVLEDTKKQNEKTDKEATRDLLKAELKTSIVIDCIRTSNDYLDQVKSFLNRMEEKFRENPKILEDFEKTLDWKELYDMCTKLKSLYDGEGSIIRQMHQETNFRAPATILQLALAKTLGILDTYRNWAHKLTVSPRQYQRIRERLGEWPEKRAATIIEKSLGSVSCPNCRFNLVTHKEHPRFNVVDTKDNSMDYLQIYLGKSLVQVPEQFQKHGATPIQVCEQLFLNKLNK